MHEKLYDDWYVGLAPVQTWISVADAVWTSVKTVLDTWKNF